MRSLPLIVITTGRWRDPFTFIKISLYISTKLHIPQYFTNFCSVDGRSRIWECRLVK